MKCNVAIWKGLNNRIKYIEDIDLSTALDVERTFQKKARRFIVDNELDGKNVIYSAKEYDKEHDVITTIHLFKETIISDEEVYALPNKMPHSIFGVIHSANLKTLKKLCEAENGLRIANITLDAANDFLKANKQKRSYSNGKGDRCLAISLKTTDNEVVGVAMWGLDKKSGDIEVRRLYTRGYKGDKDSAWKLYNTCIQIAKYMGYETVHNLRNNFSWISKDVPDAAIIQENRTKKDKYIAPISLDDANAFVAVNHRHNDTCTGHKFSLGLYRKDGEKDKLIGVAICGRSVSFAYNGKPYIEISRVCTIESGNNCSMLYGRCTRIAKELGYEKIITYTLESEPGASVKAANFYIEEEHAGGEWTGERAAERRAKRKAAGITRREPPPDEVRYRWVKFLTA